MTYTSKLTPLALSSLLLTSASCAYAGNDFLNEFWSGPVEYFECRFGLLNSTPLGLPRCMQADNVFEHLEMLNDIARANKGTRAAGLKGYEDSVDYIKSTLERVGYKVELDPVPFTAFYSQGPGTLKTVGDPEIIYEFETDFNYLAQTDAGDATGLVEAVNLDLGPDNNSSSGCEAEDFAGFTAGNIALIQRGACPFLKKAENAAAAGAVGVIIFNQGDSDKRKGLINADLKDGYSGGIPVFFATYDNGVAWSEAAVNLNMVADVVHEQTEVMNIIAETKRGNPDNIVMVGANLDSVFESAGINGNGTGSAAILEMALQMRNAHMNNKVRFAWWGAKESSLAGSIDYVLNLPKEEKDKIKVYLDFNMIASPNYAYTIYDGDGSEFALKGPPGSKATEALFEKYFKLRHLEFEGSEISFRSDYAQFFQDGIAFGGLFSGADGLKTEEQAVKYGGTAGEPFDPCYHQACDDINNLNMEALEINGDAMAFVTSWLSLSTKELDQEITDAEKPVPALPMQESASYDVTHWGQEWIQ